MMAFVTIRRCVKRDGVCYNKAVCEARRRLLFKKV